MIVFKVFFHHWQSLSRRTCGWQTPNPWWCVA